MAYYDDSIIIEIPKEGNIARITKGNSTESVTVESVCNAFAKNASFTSEDVPIGVRRIIRGSHSVAYVFTIPKGRRNYSMSYGDGDERSLNINKDNIIATHGTAAGGSRWITINVPYPALVIVSCFTINGDGKLCFSRQYAYASDDINKPVSDINLYRFPYTNVFNDNHVCTGSVASTYTIDQVGSTPGILLSGIGNHDLEVYFEKGNSYGVRKSYELLAYFANHPEAEFIDKELLGNRLYTIKEIQSNWIY